VWEEIYSGMVRKKVWESEGQKDIEIKNEER
jgi:hypothetical protein